jgi:Zn-dependent peptidase ImmA (M78 family)/transcriptional regulator with XRE-family HTH domain
MSIDNFFVKRLIAYRELNNVTQGALAAAMEFKDRQTLSSIEIGDRILQPKELIKALKFLNVSFSEFSEPYSLIGEANYSWRQNEASQNELSSFESLADRVIALYRELDEKYATSKLSIMAPKLPIQKNSSFNDVRGCAEQLVREFDLGDFPAETLNDKFFKKINVSKLYMKMPSSISGAAIKLNNRSVILINYDEVLGRQNFNIAHEAFHCLTWDALPPKHIEDTYSSKSRPRIEKLADAFASSLLMPESSINKYFKIQGVELNESILNSLANRFCVSSQALKWRLVVLNKITKSEAEKLDDNLLINNGKEEENVECRLFNEQYVKYLVKALDHGIISVRKMASIMGFTIEELSELFQEYNLTIPYDL